MIEKKTVRHVAKLARLGIGEKELEEYAAQLERILAHLSSISEIDTESVAPLSHPLETEGSLREDRAEPSLPRSALTANTRHAHEGFYRVKKVLE